MIDETLLTEDLSEEERTLLRRYLWFYRSLESGRRVPTTEAQRDFVAVCSGLAAAETPHEMAYAKYMRLRPKQQSIVIEDFRDRYDREH
jgi:uncharacterized protein YifE (UPF0438 family)